MSTVSALPPTLRDALHSLARRIRWLRVLRGLSIVLLTLLVTGAVALGLDAWLELPGIIRGVLLASWICLGLWTAWVAVLAPLLRSLHPEALAALIEERYPDLGERLTSAVELAEENDGLHGSPVLIAMLLEETETRTRRLDVTQAFSPRLALALAGVAGVGLFGAACPALLWPDRCVELGRRFLSPWQTSERIVPYVLEVTPGDVFAAKDRPFTVSIHVRPLDPEHPVLPKMATLVCTDNAGQAQRLPMLVERTDAFSVQLDRVVGDFDYHVEAGAARSDRHRVTVVEPANLADDSPVVTVTPPAYAREAFRSEKTNGFSDLATLERSRLCLDFQFTRPVVAAVLEWTSRADEQGKDKVRTIPLSLSADLRAGHAELPTDRSGAFKLVLEVEHGIRTEFGPRVLTIQPDQAPVFVKVSGLPAADAPRVDQVPAREDLRMVLPFDSVPLEAEVADDIGVSQLQLEYRVNEDPAVGETIPLAETNAPQTAARHAFKLRQLKLKDGDVVRYRLKVADNRQVPEAKLGPNVTFHPANRWLTLQVASNATPLRQQEIVAQREEIQQSLEAIKKELQKEQRGLYKLREESRDRPALKPEQSQELKQLRQENRASENALRELAKDAAATPALASIADRAQNVADEEMQRSDKALQAAQKEARPEPRDERLRRADAEVTAALQRLEELDKANQRVAQERLDQMKLEMLADRQQQLADRASEQVERDPVKQSRPTDLEQIKRDQGDLANELQRLAEQSEALREALDAARGEEAKQLAQKIRELAQAQRDLQEAARSSEKKAVGPKLDELARQQQALAEQAERLAQETRQPAQAAKTSPLKPDDAKRAAAALKEGDTGIALRHQDQSARDLERLAKDLDRARELANDPREAARQLARLQEGLRKDVQDRVKNQNPKAALAGQLQKEQEQQEALRRAVENLAVPGQQRAALDEQKRAVDRAKQATKALYKPNPAEADAQMRETKAALERLAERLPALEDRQRQAKDEVARLRRQQDEIYQQAERALKETKDKSEDRTKRLAETSRRQAASAERLKKLDAPDHKALAEQTQEALEQARMALRDAEPEAVRESQQEARQQLEHLEKALANRPRGSQPASQEAQAPQGLPSREQSETARQLAKEQQRLREETQRLAPSPNQTERSVADLAGQQKAIAKQAGELGTQTRQEQGEQAPVTQRSRQAAKSANDASNRLQVGALPEALKSGEQSAQQLRQLAQELSQTPRGQADPRSQDPLQAARNLAEDQEKVNERLTALAEDPGAQRAQQAGQQQRLEKDAGQLQREMQQLAQQMGRSPQAQQSTQRASNSGQQAQDSMRQAREQQRQNNRGQSGRNQERAAGSLDRAAEQLDQAARQMMSGEPVPQQGTGQSVQQAQGQMRQAQSQMDQNQRQGAQTAMQRAADALQQAAQQMAQLPPPNPQPNEFGAPGGGGLDLRAFTEDAKQYAGKRWGELPGELRTKIVQDLKARYGDDYARIIKLYFEQIADTQRK